MIDESTEVSTGELCALVGLSKQRLSQLASAGIIHRVGQDRWLLAPTLRALFGDARSRSAAHSEAKARMETARARALELKVQREEGRVAPVQETIDSITTVVGKVVVGLDAFAPRLSRNVEERHRVDALIRELRASVADWCGQEAARLEEVARKSARQRL